MQTTLTLLSPPKSRKAELLRDMIEGKMIAEQDYDYNRFRGDISDLRLKYNVPVRFAEEEFTSKYGHPRLYHKHYILTIDREKCVEIYEKLNK
jgi:hypothetical protein